MKQKQPVILIAIFSALLAVCTLIFIEYLDSKYGIEKRFLAPQGNMKQFQVASGESYLKSVQALIIMILILFVLYAVVYLVFFECVALVYFFISSKWYNPEVFISYKKTEEGAIADTTNIALTIKKMLEQKRFTVHFLKYSRTRRHDNVNNEIQNMLRRAHAMIAIPDPYHPSYVDNEIGTATYAEKPVFIIKHTSDQKLPNTANSGHTVLLLDKLEKEKFQPLVYLLQYVHKNWHTRLFIPGKPFLFFFESVTDIIEGIKEHVWAFAGFVLAIILLIFFSVKIEYVLLGLKIIITGIGTVAAFITLKNILQSIHLQKVIRQSILGSGKTYELYKEAEFPENILDCIDKTGLKIKHK